jgi:hypothetical protein
VTEELILAGLTAIEAIINAIKNAQSGDTNAATVLVHLQALSDALAANDAAAKASLDAKFPTGAA